jgi:hypothetical protein
VDVEPFPRIKLMKLYYLNLEELKDLPDKYGMLPLLFKYKLLGYKFLSQELTRFRMKVVDENKSIRVIEEKIAGGLIEELIYQAHNELKLIRIMKNWKPWEYLFGEITEKETLINMLSVSNSNPFPSVSEHYYAQRHDRPQRKASAGIHPEEKDQ